MNRDVDRKLAPSFFWKFLERCCFAAVQLVVQIIMARILAPDDFGTLAIMLAFTNVGIVIVQSGLNTALIQDPDVEERDYSTVFWMSLGASAVMFVALFLGAPAIGGLFANPELVAPLRVMGVILIMSALTSVGVARLTRAMDFRGVFVTSVAAVGISGIVGIICALGGMGVWALVVQQVGYQVVLGVALVVVLRWLPQPAFDKPRARALFSFGWKLLVSSLIDTAYEGLGDLIIGKQFDARSLGMVSQGKRWPQAVGYLLDGSIQPVSLSAIAKLRDDAAAVKRLVRKMLCTYSYIVCLAMAALAVCAEPVVLILLGEKWLPCVPFLQIYCVVYALMPIHTTNLQAMNAMGRSDLFLKLSLIRKTYGVVLLLIAAFVIRDVYWVAASYVVSGVISTFVNAVPNGRLCGYTLAEQVEDIAPAFGVAIAAATLAWPITLLHLPAAGALVVQLLIVCCAYLVISWVFRMRGLGYAAEALRSLAERFGKRGNGEDV